MTAPFGPQFNPNKPKPLRNDAYHGPRDILKREAVAFDELAQRMRADALARHKARGKAKP